MTISESTTLFHKKKVVQYDPAIALQSGQDIVYRLSLEYDDKRKMPDLIAGFLEKADKNALEALIIGMWGDPYESGADEVIAALIAHAPDAGAGQGSCGRADRRRPRRPRRRPAPVQGCGR